MLVYYMCVNTVDMWHMSFCLLFTDTQYYNSCALCFVMRLRLYLTLRLLMSYIYGAPILDVSRSHTTTQHSR